MRVANIIEEGKVGGPQIRMVRVAAAIRDIDTLIVMPKANSDAFSTLCEQHNISYRQLPLSRLTKELFPAIGYLLLSPFEIIHLAWFLQRKKVDLVHASGGSWQYKGVIAARLTGTPVVWHLNDTFAPGFVRWLFRFASSLASGFIFASHRSYDYYRDLYPQGKPGHIISSLVDPEYFSPSAQIDTTEDQEFLESLGNELVIGTIANVSPVKGLETLIRAAALLHKASATKTVRFLVIGQISKGQQVYLERLKRLAGELDAGSIQFCGARDDVRAILRRCDIYVCSSNAESSPVAVWEAMAMAKPVVSTNVGDVARHVLDGKAGFIMPVGDHETMAEKITQLASDAYLREKCGKQAREIAIRSFSPDNIAKATMIAYQQVLERY
ncbi:glycosyltransferase family 4 protein [Kordiimonas pumila]|uniref:Glycosyltransferase family 4 protein n=1 Tax=Kordiimonas pumila TaxID=2161677 RepID=A0ABV7D5V0_9PROT|nr:glycosyltransferase family 4 protein [Kordiimonas pumila]